MKVSNIFWKVFRRSDRMRGIISFIEEHPDAIEQYLRDEEQRWEEVKRMSPMDPELVRQWREGTSKFRESA